MENVWTYWNEPVHITRWAFASDDWETPIAENDCQHQGRHNIQALGRKSTGHAARGLAIHS
jgi:uncharacterized protein YndB with AHSA1/START domain